jgi:hypothetical protein
MYVYLGSCACLAAVVAGQAGSPAVVHARLTLPAALYEMYFTLGPVHVLQLLWQARQVPPLLYMPG